MIIARIIAVSVKSLSIADSPAMSKKEKYVQYPCQKPHQYSFANHLPESSVAGILQDPRLWMPAPPEIV